MTYQYDSISTGKMNRLKCFSVYRDYLVMQATFGGKKCFMHYGHSHVLTY